MVLVIGCGSETSPNSNSALPNSDRPSAASTNEQPTRKGSMLTDSAPPQAESEASGEGASSVEEEALVVQPVFRPDDDRTVPDPARLAELGIQIFESPRLRLYTDHSDGHGADLPPLIDAVYEQWVKDFGPLPPARDGQEFQMSGSLITDRDRFVAAGLLPERFVAFQHGQHFGQEFWMDDHEFDYYRRHLAIHEATHCFMTRLPGIHPPLWYLEGMAEFYGTHRILPEGQIEFGVMPDQSENFPGLGRIQMIQEEVRQGRQLSTIQVAALGDLEFTRSRSVPYAWSWALCKFLDAHPRYQKRFRELGNHLVGPGFQRLANESFAEDHWLLEVEWSQFCQTIDYGWEISANAFVMDSEEISDSLQEIPFVLRADQGWQSTGLRLAPGEAVRIQASGTVVLDTEPVDWKSEPQGINIYYAQGQPIGRVRAGILHRNVIPSASKLEIVDIGREGIVTNDSGGLLMFQVNDWGQSRSNNTGAYDVLIQRIESPIATP